MNSKTFVVSPTNILIIVSNELKRFNPEDDLYQVDRMHLACSHHLFILLPFKKFCFSPGERKCDHETASSCFLHSMIFWYMYLLSWSSGRLPRKRAGDSIVTHITRDRKLKCFKSGATLAWHLTATQLAYPLLPFTVRRSKHANTCLMYSKELFNRRRMAVFPLIWIPKQAIVVQLPISRTSSKKRTRYSLARAPPFKLTTHPRHARISRLAMINWPTRLESS